MPSTLEAPLAASAHTPLGKYVYILVQALLPVPQINSDNPGQSREAVVTLGRRLSSSATLARPTDGPEGDTA